MVDLICELGVEVPERVVRECCEVDDRVEASELIGRDVPDVASDRRDRGRRRPQDAVGEERGVETDDIVSRLVERRRQDAADISVVPGDEDAHP